MRLVMAFMSSCRSVGEAELRPTDQLEYVIDLQQLSNMATDLRRGERELMASLCTANLQNFEICSSRGLLALLASRSCKGFMRGTPDLAQIYEDHFRQLVCLDLVA
jgi:hypothetical protein